MSLVSYDYSDSGDSDTEASNEPESNIGKVLLHEEIFEETTELFSTLPTPKCNSQILIEEDDEFLKKTVPKSDININKTKNTVKISVPSVSDFNDADEVPKKKLKPALSSATTGLFAILPPPKTVKAPTTKFIPHSVSKKPSQPAKHIKSTVTTNKEEDIDIIDDAKPNTDSFFFTSIFDNIAETKIVPETVIPVINVDCARNVQEADLKTNKYFTQLVKNTNNAVPLEGTSSTSTENDLVKEAYTQLVGKSRKAKGKGKAKQELDIIDINAADIMPDPRDWMTKSLTEEQNVVTVKKGEEPSLQQRRKHQITYLAYQAKVNEQELKNQWAMNRMSRKQTQAKYGF